MQKLWQIASTHIWVVVVSLVLIVGAITGIVVSIGGPSSNSGRSALPPTTVAARPYTTTPQSTTTTTIDLPSSANAVATLTSLANAANTLYQQNGSGDFRNISPQQIAQTAGTGSTMVQGLEITHCAGCQSQVGYSLTGSGGDCLTGSPCAGLVMVMISQAPHSDGSCGDGESDGGICCYGVQVAEPSPGDIESGLLTTTSIATRSWVLDRAGACDGMGSTNFPNF
jgi:hypothetical protein